MASIDSFFPRLPAAVRQGLTLLSGTTLAQVVPAIAAPLLTRLYRPTDFGDFAVVLAIFGVLAPIACMRYELAIMLPEGEEEAAHLTLLCLIISATLAGVAIFAPLGLWLVASQPRVHDAIPLLLLMLPLGFLLLGVQSVSQNWSLRTNNYRIQSKAIIAQALVTIGVQTALAAALGSSAYFLVIGTLAGYVAPVVVYRPVMHEHVLPRLKEFASIEGAKKVARAYLRFPIYTGPYVMVGQAILRGVFLVLAALTTSAIVGQYALAQRVILLPVFTIMSAVSQIFFSRAAQKLEDPRMSHMVRTALITGPLIVGPLFMLAFLCGEPFFMAVFGRNWQQAGRFAVILAVPAMVRTLTVWLDRVYDIRSRQRLALTITAIYAVVALAAMYAALTVSGDPEFGVECYAAITALFYLVWLICALWVANFNLRFGADLVISTVAMASFMIAGDWTIALFESRWLVRLLGDLFVALPVVGIGVWIAAKRMREMRLLPLDPLEPSTQLQFIDQSPPG
jgi:O-antigen/teichoic acid export membrane protein